MTANTAMSFATNAHVTNHAFLQAIFGEPDSLSAPALVSFAGDPKENSSWLAVPWLSEDKLSSAKNNYFSLARYRVSESEPFQRKKNRFMALHALTLDDVGTKVDLDRIALEPTWAIETSAGNFQYGFILAEPLEDLGMAERLSDAIITAKLSDPGNDAPATRLARLPVGMNLKSKPGFACQLSIWHPHLRYTPDEIIAGLGLQDLVKGYQSPEDVVVLALKDKGLYREHLGAGRHAITCPWGEAHAGSVERIAHYMTPTEEHPDAVFRCHHPFCKQRDVHQLRQFLGLERSSIVVIEGHMNRLVEQAVDLLSETGRYFRSHEQLVVVSEALRTSTPSVEALSLDLGELADWRKPSGQGALRPIEPPRNLIQHVLNGGRLGSLNELLGTVSQPFLRPDGSLITQSGYDPQTKMYASFDSNHYSVPEHPTKSDAERALDELNELLGEFPFAESQDRSAALAGILTATIRSSLPTAPMFHVKADTSGSGKSYLCSLLRAFASNRLDNPDHFPPSSEECDKLLLSLLRKSVPVIEFDNLTGDITDYASLCTALSSPHINGRILGRSETQTVSTRALMLSSGNNVGPSPDLRRRVVPIAIQTNVEIPASRSFQNPTLVSDVRNRREHYVSLALTVIRAFIESGEQISTQPFGSYNEWTEWCRKPLIWLGFDDPFISVMRSMNNDPERESLRSALGAWQAMFGSTPTTINQACIEPFDDDREERKMLWTVLHEIAPDGQRINHRRLARWIGSRRGRIVGGLRFVRGQQQAHTNTWFVEQVSAETKGGEES